jgi:hypothetical protein
MIGAKLINGDLIKSRDELSMLAGCGKNTCGDCEKQDQKQNGLNQVRPVLAEVSR